MCPCEIVFCAIPTTNTCVSLISIKVGTHFLRPLFQPGTQAWVHCLKQGLKQGSFFRRGTQAWVLVPTRDSSMSPLFRPETNVVPLQTRDSNMGRGSNQGLKHGSFVQTRNSSVGPLFKPRLKSGSVQTRDWSLGPLL